MRNNDDPIQDMSPFRMGLDNLTENQEINNDYSSDLHNCSNDLSNKGSIREEIAHAEFARKRREEMLENTDRYAEKQAQMRRKTKTTFPTVFIIFIFIFFSIVVNMLATIIPLIGEMGESLLNSDYTYYDSGSYDDYEVDTEEEYISYEDEMTMKEQIFEDARNNIHIETTLTEDRYLILDMTNENSNMLKNVMIQVIFYDVEDKPVKICEDYKTTLFANGRTVCRLTSVPDNYERFDILITQPYSYNEDKEISLADFELFVTQNNSGDFDVELKNNSEYKVSTATVAAIYYKEDRVVNIQDTVVLDIRSGGTEFDKINNYQDENSYDRVEFIINDAVI